MNRLLLIPFMVLLTIPSNAQDSLAVSLPAWDIQYHVFSGENYLQIRDNPYGNERAIFLYETKYLQAVHVRMGDACASYLPSRNGGYATLKKSGTSCSLFNFLMSQVLKLIQESQTQPLEKHGD